MATKRNRATDDPRRSVWLEATESFYKKLNRIAKQCDLTRYDALSRGLDALRREAEVRKSTVGRLEDIGHDRTTPKVGDLLMGGRLSSEALPPPKKKAGSTSI
ncbi:MAG TPA: hypothetical protein VLJ11_20840 [Bryobacteraceae bacterium]|nr:hypothetical protein [Bryobacteraceae bacterium]